MTNESKFLEWEPIGDMVDSVKQGQRSATELVKRSLEAIARAADYNAVITTTEDTALKLARDIDADPKGFGRLAGVPFIAKDNFLTSGITTTAGSNLLKTYVPPYSATVIDRLQAEGAVLVAKANLDAFAHGSSTENSDFGPTLNPHDKTRVPGGSSGGSAAAVALGLTPLALGSDTGGSIRLPASYCGVVGYKPTYGLVSRYGVVAMASSTDCMGPITRRVDDAALVLDVIAGHDGHDSTMIARESTYDVGPVDFSELKIGVVDEFLDEGVDDDVKLAVEAAVELAKGKGAQVSTLSLPSTDLALAVYYIIVPAEVSSNLSRYDGTRYGLSVSGAKDIDELYELTRSQGFNPENKRRIMIGTHVLSSGYYDAYYKKAQTVRTKIINEFDHAFNNFDVLIGPTAPSVAFKLGANTQDPLKMYLSDVLTVAANLTGIPAISLPAGRDRQSLPIGLQLMAQRGQDRELLAAAKAFEGLING